MISEDRLAEWEAAYQAASPGLWYRWDRVFLMAQGTGPLLDIAWHTPEADDAPEDLVPLLKSSEARVMREEDARFMVLMHNVFPALVDEVRRLHGALEHSAQQLEALGEAWRCDWLGFDGRQLRDQLSKITMWMRQPEGPLTEGTEFYHSHVTVYHDFFPGCPREFGCYRCEQKRQTRARVKRPITKRTMPIHKEVKAPWIK